MAGRKKIQDMQQKRIAISITLPRWLVDLIPGNRSKFIEEAIKNEISRTNK